MASIYIFFFKKENMTPLLTSVILSLCVLVSHESLRGRRLGAPAVVTSFDVLENNEAPVGGGGEKPWHVPLLHSYLCACTVISLVEVFTGGIQ